MFLRLSEVNVFLASALVHKLYIINSFLILKFSTTWSLSRCKKNTKEFYVQSILVSKGLTFFPVGRPNIQSLKVKVKEKGYMSDAKRL